jgi:mono/diheme cytochrome c family protein
MIRYIIPALLLLACSQKSAIGGAEAQSPEEKLQARGRSIYMSQCIACHNPSPDKDGSLGPAVANSSRQLLEARILRAEYPTGYRPKRTTKIMPKLPQLKNDLDALHAYLTSPAATGSH